MSYVPPPSPSPGGGWQHAVPPSGTPQPAPPPWWKRPGPLAGVTLAVIAVIAVAIVGVVSLSSDDASGGDTTGPAAVSIDAALDAVCEPGTFVDKQPTFLQNADAQARCFARGRSQQIFIGQYSSPYGVTTDAAAGYIRAYATAELQDGDTSMFGLITTDVTTLIPLRDLGFTIHQ